MLNINDLLTHSLIFHLKEASNPQSSLEELEKHTIALPSIAQTIAILKESGVCSVCEDTVNVAIANIQLQSTMSHE